MNKPAIVCVCCQTTEVAWDQAVCDACRPSLEAAGVIDANPTHPEPDNRIQIGPTDI